MPNNRKPTTGTEQETPMPNNTAPTTNPATGTEQEVTMANDAKKKTAAKRMELVRKLTEMRGVFFHYSKLDYIEVALEAQLEMGNLTPQRGTPARCLLLTGNAGVGKSTLMERYRLKHQPYEQDNRLIVPVLTITVHRACTPKLLAEQMLRAMGVPEGLCSKGTEMTLTQRVKHHLLEQRVQVVVLDEFQHLLDHRSKHGVSRVADYIKTLLNMGVASFVLSGVPEAEAIYTENLQLMRRSLGHFQLKPLDKNDPQDRVDYKEIIRQLQELLPVPTTVDLTHKVMRHRLLDFAEGTIGRTVDFLHALGTRAISQNLDFIDYGLIKRTAYEMRDATKGAAWVNPFDLDDGSRFLKPDFKHLAKAPDTKDAAE